MRKILTQIRGLSAALLAANMSIVLLFQYLLKSENTFLSFMIVSAQIIFNIAAYYIFQRRAVRKLDRTLSIKSGQAVIADYALLLLCLGVFCILLVLLSPGIIGNASKPAGSFLNNMLAYVLFFVYTVLSWVITVFFQNLIIKEKLASARFIKKLAVLVRENIKIAAMLYLIKIVIVFGCGYILLSRETSVMLDMIITLFFYTGVDTMLQVVIFALCFRKFEAENELIQPSA